MICKDQIKTAERLDSSNPSTALSSSSAADTVRDHADELRWQRQPQGDKVSDTTEQGTQVFVADGGSTQSSAQSLQLSSDYLHGRESKSLKGDAHAGTPGESTWGSGGQILFQLLWQV